MAQKYRFWAVFLCFDIVKKQSVLLKNKLVIGSCIKYNIEYNSVGYYVYIDCINGFLEVSLKC